jgi:Zn-dependent peptidase ImmA (M78 family)
MKRPAAATVAQLALSLGVDPSFFLPGPGDYLAGGGRKDLAFGPQTPHFRSLRSATQIVRDQASAYGLLVGEIAASLERHVELPVRDLPHFPVSPDTPAQGGPEEAARILRKDWNLPPGPIRHLIRLAEHHGIIVVFSLPQAASIDAFSLETFTRPLIMLNPIKDDYFRQRFDVAHEIGHLVMHPDAEPGNRVAEDQAHRFAAEFLMPESDIADSLPSKANWPRLFALKETWGVSIQALLMRARQLSIMPENAFSTAMTTLSSRGWRRREPGVMPLPERPSLLPRSVELLAEAGYDPSRLAAECRVPIHIFNAATSREPFRTLDLTGPFALHTGGK